MTLPAAEPESREKTPGSRSSAGDIEDNVQSVLHPPCGFGQWHTEIMITQETLLLSDSDSTHRWLNFELWPIENLRIVSD